MSITQSVETIETKTGNTYILPPKPSTRKTTENLHQLLARLLVQSQQSNQ